MSHMHIAHFPQQLKNLITARQLDTKFHTSTRLRTLLAKLNFHPNQIFVHQLMQNLQYGCNIS